MDRAKGENPLGAGKMDKTERLNGQANADVEMEHVQIQQSLCVHRVEDRSKAEGDM